MRGNMRTTTFPASMTSCRQLTQLRMSSHFMSPVLATLQTLKQLHVWSISEQGPSTTYWTQLTALTELQLRILHSGAIPSGWEAMNDLRKLCIVDAELGNLPAGPYLSRLESLSLSSCTFQAG